MRIKEFEAYTLKECLQRVRTDLGSDAVILDTQKLKRGGILGFGARDAVRVIAATGVTVGEAANVKREEPAAAPQPSARHQTKERTAMQPKPQPQPTAASAKQPEPGIDNLKRELSDLRSGFDEIKKLLAAGATTAVVREVAPADNTPFPELYKRLTDNDVCPQLARELLAELPDLAGWTGPARLALAETTLADRMAARIQTGGWIEPNPEGTRVVALVGPTGVGKTTTIAKLAAHFALVDRRRVALVSMDTYRIAAVEQLKTYSRIIDLPVQVAHSVADVPRCLEAFRNYDLVLIDTAGRSQKHGTQMEELRAVLQKLQCDTHLVVSSGTKLRDLEEQVQRFSDLGADRLLFTKLDETGAAGTLFSVAARLQLPISYITTGQQVPEDIEAADAERIVRMALRGTEEALAAA
jgi:flagellar biosynthesis protein FlhF